MAVICDICDNCHFIYMHACIYAVLPCKGVGSKTDSLFNMLIKLVQIPAYLAIFVLGVLFFLTIFTYAFFCFFRSVRLYNDIPYRICRINGKSQGL